MFYTENFMMLSPETVEGRTKASFASEAPGRLGD